MHTLFSLSTVRTDEMQPCNGVHKVNLPSPQHPLSEQLFPNSIVRGGGGGGAAAAVSLTRQPRQGMNAALKASFDHFVGYQFST